MHDVPLRSDIYCSLADRTTGSNWDCDPAQVYISEMHIC